MAPGKRPGPCPTLPPPFRLRCPARARCAATASAAAAGCGRSRADCAWTLSASSETSSLKRLRTRGRMRVSIESCNRRGGVCGEAVRPCSAKASCEPAPFEAARHTANDREPTSPEGLRAGRWGGEAAHRLRRGGAEDVVGHGSREAGRRMEGPLNRLVERWPRDSVRMRSRAPRLEGKLREWDPGTKQTSRVGPEPP